MANGFANQVTPPAAPPPATNRPPTGGPSTLDAGTPTAGATAGGGGGVSGFADFTPVQGAGFNAAPGFNSSGQPFGLGIPADPGPGQFGQGNVPFGGGGLSSLQNQGAGGFSASPRLLTGAEITQLNQNFGIQGTPDQFHQNPFNTRQQLGAFGFIADPSTFSRSQLPAIETRLNFENLLQAQTDRQSAMNLLQEQRARVGQSPEQQQALSVAIRRLENPEPFTPEEVSQQQSAIRQRGAQGLEAAQRQQAQSLAQQGVRGGATAFQEASQRQSAGRQTSDELQRLAIENALGRDQNEAQAVDRLRQITGQDESREIAINTLLSEMLTAQRGGFDLSSLAGKERKSEQGLLSKIGFF